MISFGRCSLRERLDLVEIDQIVVAAHAILDGVEPFARHRRLGAVGEVAAGVERHAEDRVAGLGQRQHHRAVRLRARMRLDVGEAAAEQLLGPLDRQRLDRVRRRAALIVAPARIAFGIFVGEHRALRLEHRAADDILRRDQLDLVLLRGRARRGSRRRRPDRPGASVSVKKPSGWTLGAGLGGSACRSCGFLGEMGMGELVDAALVAAAAEGRRRGRRRRRPWPCPMPISRAPMRDDVGVVMLAGEARPIAARRPSAQRAAGWRLTAIEMPMPEPHRAMPRSARPAAISSAIL